MGATLDRSAAIGQRAIAISVVRARGRPCGAARCAARMGSQTAQAHFNRVCGAIDSVFSSGRGFGALLKVFVARSHFIELTFRYM